MENKLNKYFYDINISIESIENFLEGKRDFNIYFENNTKPL